ncbi:MAG TPA: hypothetical protein VLF68_03425 [Candidatus Saccharimonadales bacterium]|nr:hypothetical protein [Candidatus Saccharimonadales bacterium]
MSNARINLLTGEHLDVAKERERIAFVRIVSVICLLVVLLVSVALFLLTQSTLSSSTHTQEQSALGTLKFLQAKEVKVRLTHDRLDAVLSVLKKRNNFDSILNTVLQPLPADVSIDSLEVDPAGISILASSRSLFSLNTFTDALTNLSKKRKALGKITLNNLIFNTQSGNYSLSLKAVLL